MSPLTAITIFTPAQLSLSLPLPDLNAAASTADYTHGQTAATFIIRAFLAQSRPIDALFVAGDVHWRRGLLAQILAQLPGRRAQIMQMTASDLLLDAKMAHRVQTFINNLEINSPSGNTQHQSILLIIEGDKSALDALIDNGFRFTIAYLADTLPVSPKNAQALAALIIDIAKNAQLPPLATNAAHQLLALLCQENENKTRFSTQLAQLLPVLTLAGYLAHNAAQNPQAFAAKIAAMAEPFDQSVAQHAADLTAANPTDAPKITHLHLCIARALVAQNPIKTLYWQDLADGQHAINLAQSAVGQTVALTVLEDNGATFGIPNLISAQVIAKHGAGEVLDIERDVELGGSLHAKSLLIVTGLLHHLFGGHCGLAFKAQLTFEQNYGEIDGDSASLAAAAALFSALGNAPIRQNLAVTGSLNQRGQVQAVGAVVDKIQAFFALCALQNFPTINGKPCGVIVPLINQTALMLPDDILNAVAAGQFVVYGVADLAAALSILLDIKINIKSSNINNSTYLYASANNNNSTYDKDTDSDDDSDLDNPYPTGTLYHLILARLQSFDDKKGDGAEDDIDTEN